MNVPFSLSAIHLYIGTGTSNRLAIHPDALSKNICFSTCTQLLVKLAIVWQESSAHKKLNADVFPLPTGSVEHPIRRKIFFCFLTSVKGHSLCSTFFRLSPKWITQDTLKLCDLIDPPPLLVIIKTITRLKFHFDHCLLSRYLSQEINQKTSPYLVNSSRSRLLAWLERNFHNYLRIDLQSDRLLDSEIVLMVLKKWAWKELKDVLIDGDVRLLFVKCFLKPDRLDVLSLSDLCKKSIEILFFKNLLQKLSNQIVNFLDNSPHLEDFEQQEEHLIEHMRRYIQIIRELIFYMDQPSFLRERKQYYSLKEKSKVDTAVPFYLLRKLVEIFTAMTSESDVLSDFQSYEYYESYRRVVLYFMLRAWGEQKPVLMFQEKKILAFLEGNKNLNELNITTNNARAILITVKIIDMALRRYAVASSYTTYERYVAVFYKSRHLMSQLLKSIPFLLMSVVIAISLI